MNRRMQTNVRENSKTTSFILINFEHFNAASFEENNETTMTKNQS